jgi:hypothetical protein
VLGVVTTIYSHNSKEFCNPGEILQVVVAVCGHGGARQIAATKNLGSCGGGGRNGGGAGVGGGRW